jgi:hypothetical protein
MSKLYKKICPRRKTAPPNRALTSGARTLRSGGMFRRILLILKIKYYEYVRPKPCNICGCIINTHMLRHYRSKKCQLVRAGITNTVVKIENAISPFKMEDNGSPAFTSQSSTSVCTVEYQKNVDRYVEQCKIQMENANSGKYLKF